MIDLKFQFVPFSQSRNKGNKHPSINWLVTLREGFTVEYMQGSAHTPAYQKPSTFPNSQKVDRHTTDRRIHEECETGQVTNRYYGHTTRINLAPPLTKDVMQSLLLDADVLNYAGFEAWATEFGYDPDSIKAQKIYQECLATALKLNAYFNIAELQKEYADE